MITLTTFSLLAVGILLIITMLKSGLSNIKLYIKLFFIIIIKHEQKSNFNDPRRMGKIS